LHNYKFVESTQTPEIQIADVTIGLYARLINFCKNKSTGGIREIRKNLNKNQLDLLKKAGNLVERSNQYSRCLFRHFVPQQELGKWTELIR
ncbi:MAG: hypothetical protein ACRCTU_12030, partial [Zoogloea sp.]|uniref:hypothetical protein n=1 Tax=Zoogloea sp. TaxID=49181 RepID=UPI003F3B70C1